MGWTLAHRNAGCTGRGPAIVGAAGAICNRVGHRATHSRLGFAPGPRAMPRSLPSILGYLILAGVGCNGGGGSGGDDDGGSSDGSGTATGDETGGPGSCAPAPDRVGLQRLTRAEYNRTVGDLFGVTSAPADAFPPDSATNGFDNNAASLTVSPQLAALLFDAAETIAAEAMVNRGDEIVTCDPATVPTCARDVLAALGLRVYRRPPTDAELDDLLALVELAADEGEPFAATIQHALTAMLMSPQFLYRNVPAEGAAPLGPGELVALDDWALATRLSYFLWGSTPDDALLARAGEGSLHDQDVLRAEFDRMLADPKAGALYDGFAVQWLQLGKLAAAAPDAAAFPAFDEALRTAMLDETRLFFADLRARDGSPLEIVTGTRTFANEALAAIYGVGGVTGTELVAIDTDPSQRAGLLTMPAVLTMTSDPAQPNIVKRGVWLADAILCASPPPPPEGIPPAPDPEPGETERERLERHRQDPSCNSCHQLIDPLGFALENYDAVGAYRTEIDGAAIDNAGALPSGATFAGAVELAAVLAGGPEYPSCISSKLMTYALGRTMSDAEQCVVDDMGANHVTVDATISDLLWAVVTSDAFVSEQSPEGT